MTKRVLITGVAGFIGFHLCMRLIEEGYEINGIDNMNNYYDPRLKKLRLKKIIQIAKNSTNNFIFNKIDLADIKKISTFFHSNKFDYVIHLAAQAGVRYSINNPNTYAESNLKGFLNVLEGCRRSNIKHLIFASSSSIYGMNNKVPFSVSDNSEYPISLYAATKKANELMAHSYSHLYNIPITGLRFFTVYGPYGRPDMAYFKFTKAIIEGKQIEVFNSGKIQRDFTYIDDVIEGIVRVLTHPPKLQKPKTSKAKAKFKVYNIGNNNPVRLSRFIKAIESSIGISAKKINLPMQAGDVPITYADIDELISDFKFNPNTSIEVGIQKFVEWYKNYSL